MQSQEFIADVHLGRLARLLRMLGFDTVYQNNFSREDLIAAARVGRILLTRAEALAKEVGSASFWIKSKDAETQLISVLNHFALRNSLTPFTRCMACNGRLAAVTKEDVAHLLPPETSRFFKQFWQCPDCKRVYWKGVHYDRMLAKMGRLGITLP